MKKSIIALLLILNLFQFGVFAQNQEGQGVERYALYIASNLGGEDRATLRYAGSDAEKLSATMIELGGVKKQNSFVLIDSTKSEIDGAFKNITAIINNSKTDAKRVEFLFYYSGHSDENALLLGEEAYDYSELKAKISSIPSDVHVVVLDSCFSGNFIRAKGGSRQKSFLVDDSSVVKGHAYLSSSSETESSQESDDIEASYFTQALITGLRGAADTSGDNRVSLNELYYYAFNETLKQTETSAIGTQHPSFDITLVGSGDLVLTDISTAEAVLVLPPESHGRFLVRNIEGKLAAEINKVEGTLTSLALPSGFYTVTLIGDKATAQAQVKLVKNDIYTVKTDSLSQIALSQGVARGSSEGETTNRPSSTSSEPATKVEDPKLPGTSPEYLTDEEIEAILSTDNFAYLEKEKDSYKNTENSSINYYKENSSENKFGFTNCTNPKTNIEINIFGSGESVKDSRIVISPFAAVNHCVQGLQASGFSSVIQNSLQGFQLSGISNVVKGKIQGFQFAGIVNTAHGTFAGGQFAGLVNNSKGKFQGIQSSGLVNIADNMQGFQTGGFINIANNMKGFQFSGFINIAKEITGVQVGVINIANSCKGVSFGLINVIKDGIIDPAFYWENDDMFIQYQSGTNSFFTTFLAGTHENFSFDYGILGFGIGTRLGKGFFGVDIELLCKQLLNYSFANDISKLKNQNDDNFEKQKIDVLTEYTIPAARITLNMRFGKGFGIFFGANTDLEILGRNEKAFANRNTGKIKLHEFDNMSFKTHTSVSFGFKF